MSVIEYASRELSARESIAGSVVDVIRNKHHYGWDVEEIVGYLYDHLCSERITSDFVQQVINKL